MNVIKKILQTLWNIILSIYRAVVKLVQWWIAKIKTSGSKKGAVAWLVGGLISACFLCSLLYSMTPGYREFSAERNITRTAVAIAEATSDMATRNAPTNTPTSTSTLEPTETTQPTDTSVPTTEPSQPPPPPTPTETLVPTQVSIEPLVTITGGQVNIRSGPGTDYSLVQTLEQGDTVPATGFNSGQSWVQIELPDGKSGWVGTDLVDIQNPEEITTVTDIPTAPVVQEPAPLPPTTVAEATLPPEATAPPPPPTENCDRVHYPTVCIPPKSEVGDLKCDDVFPLQNFTVVQPDPHGFDGNKDGVGCEG